MNTQIDMELPGDAILFAGEGEETIAVWTLDDLDQFTDLDSIRSAWARTDGPGQ
jgi:hypothetical protein